MRNPSCFSALVALSSLFVTSTAFGQKPKHHVDFSAAAPVAAASLIGPTGVIVKVKSASIAKDGTIQARVTVTDTAGTPLDRLGIATAGPITISMIAAYIPAGKTQYTSYTTTVLNSTINSNPPQTQAANDSGGVFTTNAIGDYTYTFKTKAPVGFDATVTHSLGVSAVRNLAAYGEYDEWSLADNDVFNFVPDGSAVKTTRAVTATATCNGCHNPLWAHGGQRVKVEHCILCHSPQTTNPDTLNSMDMPVLVHKLHAGADLPSVKAGGQYRIWHRGAWTDFTTVKFPQPLQNCTTCHTAGQAQSDNWKTNPTIAACGACHDNVNFATGQNHPAGPATDSQCKNCHTATRTSDFDASIPGAHVLANNSSLLTGLKSNIVKIDNAIAGSAPIVTFGITDKAGNAVDISKLSSVRVILAGPNTDYQTGPGAIRASENPAATPAANGLYAYQMTNKIPAAGTGSYTVSIEARNSVTLMAGTTKQRTAIDWAMPVRQYFSIDKSEVIPRRQVVSNEKCGNCHKDLTFIHSATRSDVQECVMCHNPSLVDNAKGQSVNFATQIHRIHRGESLANPYMLGTVNYQEVRFPGDLRDCNTCHINQTYRVENIGAQADVANPGEFTKTTPPIAAACQGCHDDKATASHALANTTVIGESCAACHGVNGTFSVENAHKRN